MPLMFKGEDVLIKITQERGDLQMLSYAIMLNACSSNLASKHGLLDLGLVKLLKLVHNLLSLLLRLHQSM